MIKCGTRNRVQPTSVIIAESNERASQNALRSHSSFISFVSSTFQLFARKVFELFCLQMTKRFFANLSLSNSSISSIESRTFHMRTQTNYSYEILKQWKSWKFQWDLLHACYRSETIIIVVSVFLYITDKLDWIIESNLA